MDDIMDDMISIFGAAEVKFLSAFPCKTHFVLFCVIFNYVSNTSKCISWDSLIFLSE